MLSLLIGAQSYEQADEEKKTKVKLTWISQSKQHNLQAYSIERLPSEQEYNQVLENN
jgi:hypothetical protein